MKKKWKLKIKFNNVYYIVNIVLLLFLFEKEIK